MCNVCVRTRPHRAFWLYLLSIRRPPPRIAHGPRALRARRGGRNLKRLHDMVDPAGTAAKSVQRNAESTKAALSAANEALHLGKVTLEVGKDVTPLLSELKNVSAKLEQMDKRLQNLEKKAAQTCCIVS